MTPMACLAADGQYGAVLSAGFAAKRRNRAQFRSAAGGTVVWFDTCYAVTKQELGARDGTNT